MDGDFCVCRGHVGDLRRGGGVVLHRAPRGEQVRRRRPVPGHVVPVGGDARLDEEVGREEGGGHPGHGEDVVLVDEGVRQLVERRGVATVVQGVLVVDLAAVHAARGVDVVVVRPLAVDERGEVGRQRPRLGRDRPHRDGVRRHPRRRARRRGRTGRAARRRHDGCCQHRAQERHCRQRLGSMSYSHAVPNRRLCIPPGMPVTVAGGFHAHCSPLVVVSRRQIAFSSP